MDNKQQLLSQLRDIHTPTPISFWPLAPGWYIVITVIVIVLALLGFLIWRQWRQRQRRRHILQRLVVLQQTQAIAQLSVFLRRVALYRYPRQQVAGLQGKAWLAFLDTSLSKSNDSFFCSELGELLLSAPYQKHTAIDKQQVERLFALAKQWVVKHV